MVSCNARTDKDAAFLATIITHMTNKPEVDWAAVTEEMGFKTINSCRTRFGQVKKKLEDAAAPSPPANTPAKRKRKDENSMDTPSKSSKREIGGSFIKTSSVAARSVGLKAEGQYIKSEHRAGYGSDEEWVGEEDIDEY
ncbi:hypothetical protein BDZ45DRAFT_804316 [Acephala macrosclerotiorum]|nr:hypothetical protein BDZ45DRAFT_804316 [Acephala macrosclerotiorum]